METVISIHIPIKATTYSVDVYDLCWLEVHLLSVFQLELQKKLSIKGVNSSKIATLIITSDVHIHYSYLVIATRKAFVVTSMYKSLCS